MCRASLAPTRKVKLEDAMKLYCDSCELLTDIALSLRDNKAIFTATSEAMQNISRSLDNILQYAKINLVGWGEDYDDFQDKSQIVNVTSAITVLHGVLRQNKPMRVQAMTAMEHVFMMVRGIDEYIYDTLMEFEEEGDD
jgi:hypothetical protein